jgi:hypothetical protein
MPWPTIFANLAAGNQPLALFDAMFTQVAQMVAVPCTVAGVNALTLTPIGSAPTFTSYQNFTAARFIAGATTTGTVTAQFGALAALPVYLSDGVTQASTGNILVGGEYILVFAQSLNSGAGGFFVETAVVPAGAGFIVPVPNTFLSGSSATYTTPTSGGRLPLYIRVRMCGGGGGGAATSTNAGAVGTDTSFAGWTAIHGNGGVVVGSGGAGGTGGVNGGTGTQLTRLNGGAGTAGNAAGGGDPGGGNGGSTVFGGAGAGTINGAGTAAASNSGAGGGGGSSASGNSSGGGGAGEYVEFIIAAPVASYTYTVGTGGNGGAAGGAAGGNGGAGRIDVAAYWQ